MIPFNRDRVNFFEPSSRRDQDGLYERKQPLPISIPGNQIFPYLNATGEDQIADLVRLSSETYRYSSLENFCLELRLHPPTHTLSIRSSTQEFLGWQAYYFDLVRCTGAPIALPIRLLPPPLSKSGRSLAFPKVEVLYAGYWLSIPVFLNYYPPARDLKYSSSRKTSKYLYKDQFSWWNGLSKLPLFNPQRKVFRFMALPAEIRDLIYGFILPSPLRPFPGAKCRRLRGMYHIAFKAEQPDLQLLKLNKQIYREARRVLFCDTTWEISHPGILDRILFSPNLFNRVQRLRLALSHEGFTEVFCSKSGNVAANLRPLRRMKLREFVLDFAAPPGFQSSWGSSGSSGGTLACQRLILDWILQAAEPWVVGHEGVRVVGWVKRKQKAAFEELCKGGVREFWKWKQVSGKAGAELAEWDEWREEMWREEDGGVRVVEVVAEKVVEAIVEENEEERTLASYRGGSPPDCLCEVSCGLEGWTAEG